MPNSFEQEYQKDLARLRNTSAKVWREAVSNLGESYNIEAVPYLVSALRREKEDELRSYLIWNIGKLPYLSSAEAILPYLQHPDFATRVTAVDALINVVVEANNGNITDKVYDELKKLAMSNKEMQSIAISRLDGFGRKEDEQFIAFLNSTINDVDFSVRSTTVMALGLLNVQSAKYIIMNLLENDPAPEVRLGAAEALGNLAAAEALDLLLEFYEKGNNKEREVAVIALGKLGNPKANRIIRENLTAKDKPLRRAGIIALLNTNDTEKVLKSFEMLDKSEYSIVLNWLSDKKISLGHWLQLLHNPKIDEREKGPIYEGIGLTKDPLAAGLLIAALPTANTENRSSIAWALGELGSEMAINSLYNLLQEGPSPEVKKQAARGLIISGNTAAFTCLINFILAQAGAFPLDFLWVAFDKRSIPFLELLVNYSSGGNEIIESIKNEATTMLKSLK